MKLVKFECHAEEILQIKFRLIQKSDDLFSMATYMQA